MKEATCREYGINGRFEILHPDLPTSDLVGYCPQLEIDEVQQKCYCLGESGWKVRGHPSYNGY